MSYLFILFYLSPLMHWSCLFVLFNWSYLFILFNLSSIMYWTCLFNLFYL